MTGHSQGSSLVAMFAVSSHRLFTSAAHTRTTVHAAQFYTSASFNSASNLCHCKKCCCSFTCKLGHYTEFFQTPNVHNLHTGSLFSNSELHNPSTTFLSSTITPKQNSMATLFGLPSSMVAHGLPPNELVFLTAITVCHVYTAMVLRLLSRGYTSTLASSF